MLTTTPVRTVVDVEDSEEENVEERISVLFSAMNSLDWYTEEVLHEHENELIQIDEDNVRKSTSWN